MSEIISTELKSDLENMYKITGDLSNLIEAKNFNQESDEVRELIDHIKYKLEDVVGTLQKDIFNCDYLISKYIFITNIEETGGGKNG